jgi:hypothetical protein
VEQDRDRLRITASTTASPKLRIALERAADPSDEAALVEALAELEAEGGGSGAAAPPRIAP